MESLSLQHMTAWLSRPEVYGVALGVILPLALAPVFLIFARRGQKSVALHSVDYFRFDANKRYVHIIGAHTYMPDGGDSFSVYHHRLYDRESGKIYQGGHQRGAGIDLDSQFIRRTTSDLEHLVGQPLRIDTADSFDMDSENDDTGNRPICLERDWFESDTEKPKPAPKFGVIFRQSDDERERFRLSVFAHGKLLSESHVKGSFSSFHALYDADKSELLFICSLGAFYRIGICGVDMRTGLLKFERLVKPDVMPA